MLHSPSSSRDDGGDGGGRGGGVASCGSPSHSLKGVLAYEVCGRGREMEGGCGREMEDGRGREMEGGRGREMEGGSGRAMEGGRGRDHDGRDRDVDALLRGVQSCCGEQLSVEAWGSWLAWGEG